MPLAKDEREFLDAYVFEVTHGPPFGGPATTELARRGVHYSDLSWILTAYDRERCRERRELPASPNPNPPPCPWDDLQQVKGRDAALRQEQDSQFLEESSALGTA